MSLVEPKIICIMPCYNAEKTLAKAIESVINQNYENWELIIIDDASTDNSVKIAKDYLENSKITLLQNKTNRGCYYSRNRGLFHIKDKQWDWVTIHDSDDTSHPDRFSVYMAYSFYGMYDYLYSCAQGTRYNYNTQQLVFKKQNNGVGTSWISHNLFSTTLGYFDSTRFSGDSEYAYRYYQIVIAMICQLLNVDSISVKEALVYCFNNKVFIAQLNKNYSYLYNMGYTLGNNLTQQVSLQERDEYEKMYKTKWGEGGIPIKDFYRDFTPHKEDL